MVGVSLAIIVLMIVLAVMLARAGRQIIAAFTAPLVSIPVLHLVSVLLRMPHRADMFAAVGLVVGVALSVLFARAFRTAKARRGYVFGSSLFLAALFIAYLLNA